MQQSTLLTQSERASVVAVYRRWFASLHRAGQLPLGLTELEHQRWLTYLIKRRLSDLETRARRRSFRLMRGGRAAPQRATPA
jgi:hypothetical protein